MMTDDDLTEPIVESAAGPKDISIDGNQTSEHPLPDQIAAVNHVAAERAKRKPGFGISFQKIVPHGSV